MKNVFELHKKPAGEHRYVPAGRFDTRDAAAAATVVPDLSLWSVGGDPENRYIDTVVANWLITPEREPESDADRIELAVDIALDLGHYDGDHHKMYAIDQMLRVMLGDRYAAVIGQWENGEDGPGTYNWDEGIAP